jgi:hypothetical protein
MLRPNRPGERIYFTLQWGSQCHEQTNKLPPTLANPCFPPTPSTTP